MSDTDDARSEFKPWPLHDMVFAANQLSNEYPKLARDRVTFAVNSAAPFITPAEGHVQLMRPAREFIRLFRPATKTIRAPSCQSP
jgi:hypothetical protein